MNSSRELDALIAEKVLGWTEIQFIPSGHTAEIVPQGISPTERPSPYTGYRAKHVVPNYSTDIKDAWEVVEKLRSDILNRFVLSLRGPQKDCPDAWLANFSLEMAMYLNRDEHYSKFSSADTAPHAICLAALKAVGEEIK